MYAFIIVLALAGYLGFLIDWREFGGIMRQGGWAAIAVYCVVGIFVTIALVTPHAATAPMIHH